MSNIKYVRVANTNETQSDFINYIAEPITVGANAKISLDSLSILIDQSKVIVDSQLDGSFSVVNGPTQLIATATIESGNYTASSFIKELTKSINTTTQDDIDNHIRTEWQPIFTKDGKLSIQYLTCEDEIGESIITNKSIFIKEDDDYDYYGGNGGLGGITVSTTPIFINAFGICEFPLIKPDGTYPNQFACGFINRIPIDTDAILQPEDYYFCVYANAGQSDFLQVYFNGSKVTTGVNEVLLTSLNKSPYPGIIRAYNREGKLGFELADNIFPDLIYEMPYTFQENLHCAFSQYPMINPTRLVVQYTNGDNISMKFTPSPYQNITNTGVSLITKNEDKIGLDNYMQFGAVGAQPLIATIHSITLPPYTKLLLGFQQSYYEVTAIGGSFDAEDIFNTFTLDTDLIVELPSLMLHTYDGTTTRRRNIIRVIPAENVALVSGRRRYIAPYPLYISLQNKGEQILNSLQIRVLNSDTNLPLPILGERSCSLTLAITSD
jgi:hypothetical protein